MVSPQKQLKPEKIMYSIPIIKINKRKSQQLRILLITTERILNIKPKNILGKVFGTGHQVRSSFNIAELDIIIYGKRTQEFILQFPEKFDLHYKSQKRDEILDYVFLSRSMNSPLDNNIEFFFMDDRSLHKYCNHPSTPCSKIPQTEGMMVNREEFNVHFLGKPQKNLIPNSKPINLVDFEVMKMLGIGGFSKVYLVLKKDSKELYAMKSIRMPDKTHKADKAKYKEQVRTERDILVRINHPFIVKLKYAFQVRRRFFFVMPFIQ